MPIGASQQILPVAVAVAVGDGVQRCAQCDGGVGLLRLTEDIAAVVIGVECGMVDAVLYCFQRLTFYLFSSIFM